MDERWRVYIVRCADGRLYAGVTTDVARRLAEHASGKGRGARSLRGKGPLEVVFEHGAADRSEAQRLEWAIKRLSTRRKRALVSGELGVADVLPDATSRGAEEAAT